MQDIIHLGKDTLAITGFVLVMMLVIEYLNVLSKGRLEQRLRTSGRLQYITAALLGVMPGCLGSFTAVSLYTHGILSFGALVANMLATSGDAAFLMLAMTPGAAVILFSIQFVLGILVGIAVDLVSKAGNRRPLPCIVDKCDIPGEHCTDFSLERIREEWRRCSLHRGALTFFLGIFLLGVLTREIDDFDTEWMRITVLISIVAAIGIVTTVPDHFLEEHLWNHVTKKHAARIFMWTLGALAVIHLLTEQLNLEESIPNSGAGKILLLLVACIVGLIPDSAPNYIFVILYANGSIPFSVLLANTIVQDGHGMLPMLAHSWRGFVVVKAIVMTVGLCIGYGAMLAGF